MLNVKGVNLLFTTSRYYILKDHDYTEGEKKEKKGGKIMQNKVLHKKRFR